MSCLTNSWRVAFRCGRFLRTPLEPARVSVSFGRCQRSTRMRRQWEPALERAPMMVSTFEVAGQRLRLAALHPSEGDLICGRLAS